MILCDTRLLLLEIKSHTCFACMCGGMHTHRGQRSACWSQFSLSTTQDLRIKLKLSGLVETLLLPEPSHWPGTGLSVFLFHLVYSALQVQWRATNENFILSYGLTWFSFGVEAAPSHSADDRQVDSIS